jgi:acyl-CoA synthetase (AMP-forming)/AMP-acid ligase II
MEPGPELVRHWIARAADRNPQKPWIISAEDERGITYGELQRLAGRLAAFLREQRIGPNDRVALLANNSIEHLACYVGVIAYGATICTIHVEMNRHHLDSILPALNPRLIVFEDGLGLDDLLATVSAPRLAIGCWDEIAGRETLYGAVNRYEASDAFFPAGGRHDAVILFTSGTSARPKGVVLTFRELLANAGPTAAGFGLTGDDRIYDFRSFNWCSAQTLSVLPPLERGASVIIGQQFSRRRFFEYIRTYGATIATGNPTTLGMLLNGEALDAEVPGLRFITSSSAPLLIEDWRRFEERFGIRVAQGYGSSETCWIAAHPGEGRRVGTVGKPLAYHDLRIVDGAGQPRAPGESGRIELGGFADNDYRYLGDDGTITIDSRGRFKTGDLGFLDADGYLHVTGREKELIIRGGVNISPLEIDSLLMRREDIIDVATVGIPDAIYGEEVVSFVVPRPGARVDADDLIRYCATVLPAFKAPKRILLSDALPRTERGKLDRKALRERWTRQESACRRPREGGDP